MLLLLGILMGIPIGWLLVLLWLSRDMPRDDGDEDLN